MNEKMVAVKSGMAAAVTAVAAFMGWKGIMLLIWIAAMTLDYLSGTLAACRERQWSSAVARQGLWHKGGMILVVTVAALSDVVMVLMVRFLPMGMQWPGLVLPLVLAWYIMTELGSILENAVKMGAKVPAFLIGLLKSGIDLTDSAGEAVSETMK